MFYRANHILSNNIFSTNFSFYLKEKNIKLNQLILYEVGTYSLGLVAMNELWYKNYPKSNFHFINDNSSIKININIK